MKTIRKHSSSSLVITFKKVGIIWLLCTAPIMTIAQSSPEPDLTKTQAGTLDSWLLKAYEGDQEAQFKVGELYATGSGTKADQEQAMYWYQKAADQGNVLGQYNLGHHYLNGIGVEKNTDTAMQWWLKAAKQNHVLAQFNVGRAYYLGLGLPEDARSAKYWFERAAENKEPRSIAILEKLNSSNTINTAAAASEEENLKSVITPAGEVADAKPTAKSTLKPAAKPAAEEPAAKPSAQTAAKPVAEETPAPAAKTEPVTAKPAAPVVAAKQPVSLFTNPAGRSMIIAELPDGDSLKVIKADAEWSQVQNVSGFPVWIHGDFLKTDDNKHGTVTGSGVNARANPEVKNGSIVGKFTKGERVLVIDQRDGWVQVMSPTHFKAWAKTADIKKSS